MTSQHKQRYTYIVSITICWNNYYNYKLAYSWHFQAAFVRIVLVYRVVAAVIVRR